MRARRNLATENSEPQFASSLYINDKLAPTIDNVRTHFFNRGTVVINDNELNPVVLSPLAKGT